ncbi:MAG: hypothetical protein L3J53_07860 [Proteobacteria bacterium]|nr:hypothetical protein [Pseudomonadota bacterium]
MKRTRTISTSGLSINKVNFLKAYCHLLQNKLDEKWVFHDSENSITDILFVLNKYIGRTSKQARFIVTIKNQKELSQSVSLKGNISEYILYEPLNGFELVNILNNISQASTLGKQIEEQQPKKKFLIKRFLTSFIYGKKPKPVEGNDVKTHTPIQNITTPLTNKLLKLSDPSFVKSLKVVFLGRPGSGKTTAIVSAQTKNLVVCDVKATDSVGLLKDQTTIGIDYCDCDFISGVRLKVFGTPGQGRHKYLQIQTVSRADIYVILVDLASTAPFSEFQYYNNILKSNDANPNAIKLVAFTHYDLKEHNVIVLSNEIKRNCQGNVITTILDPRDRSQVREILEKMANLSLDKKPLSVVYNQNINNIINFEQFKKHSKSQYRNAN